MDIKNSTTSISGLIKKTPPIGIKRVISLILCLLFPLFGSTTPITVQPGLDVQNVLNATNSTLNVDGQGNGTITIELISRKAAPDKIYHIGLIDSIQYNEFNDLPDVFNQIVSDKVESATIYVGSGDFTWGDSIDPKASSTVHPSLNSSFSASLNVIGMGSELTRILPTAGSSAAAIFKEGGRSLYLEGLTFVGTGKDYDEANENALDVRNGTSLTLVDIVLQHAPKGDGLLCINFENVVVWESSALYNDADGFSYSNPASTGAEMMYILEANSIASINGLNGQSNSQGSTIHRATQIVRANNTYEHNPTNIEDAGLASWNFNLEMNNPRLPQVLFWGDENLEITTPINFKVRGDKHELKAGYAYFASGSFNGGIVYSHTTYTKDDLKTPIVSTVGYSTPIKNSVNFANVFRAAAESDSSGSQSILETNSDDTLFNNYWTQ